MTDFNDEAQGRSDEKFLTHLRLCMDSLNEVFKANHQPIYLYASFEERRQEWVIRNRYHATYRDNSPKIKAAYLERVRLLEKHGRFDQGPQWHSMRVDLKHADAITLQVRYLEIEGAKNISHNETYAYEDKELGGVVYIRNYKLVPRVFMQDLQSIIAMHVCENFDDREQGIFLVGCMLIEALDDMDPGNLWGSGPDLS